MGIFDELDNQFDEDFAKDVEAAGGSGDFEDVPHGEYEVKIEKLEPAIAKKSGNPIMSCWMRIINGEHKGQMVFYNQVLHKPFCVHKANEFMASLGTDVEIKYIKPSQYADVIMDVAEKCAGGEYHLSFQPNAKNSEFDEYEIVEILKAPSTDPYSDIDF